MTQLQIPNKTGNEKLDKPTCSNKIRLMPLKMQHMQRMEVMCLAREKINSHLAK